MQPTDASITNTSEALAALQLAPAVPAVSPTLPPSAAPVPKRVTRQALSDELRAEEGEELIPGAPSRNGGRFLTEDRDPWTHNAWWAPLLFL
jgi:hypothetical protein